jgi:hypothetical protein
MRREALACRASVLIAILSFDCKSGRPLNTIYPSIGDFVLRLSITNEAKLFVQELERSGFYRQLHDKVRFPKEDL